MKTKKKSKTKKKVVKKALSFKEECRRDAINGVMSAVDDLQDLVAAFDDAGMEQYSGRLHRLVGDLYDFIEEVEVP